MKASDRGADVSALDEIDVLLNDDPVTDGFTESGWGDFVRLGEMLELLAGEVEEGQELVDFEIAGVEACGFGVFEGEEPGEGVVFFQGDGEEAEAFEEVDIAGGGIEVAVGDFFGGGVADDDAFTFMGKQAHGALDEEGEHEEGDADGEDLELELA